MIDRSENLRDRKGLTPSSPSARHADAIEIARRLTPAPVRAALSALFALDARFADILATTSEPMIGQLRLAWWRDALTRLDSAPAPAEPLLRQIERDVLPHGITGSSLAAMADGWEALSSRDPADLPIYAAGRGAALFAIAAMLLDRHSFPATGAAGKAWALSQVAAIVPDRALIEHAQSLARADFDRAFTMRWPTSIRPLGVLALLARADSDVGSSRLVDWILLLRFRLIGR